MKERIKKAFEGATLNLVFAWVFVAMFVYVLVDCICAEAYVGLIVGLPFLLIAMQAFELHKIGKELREAKHIAVVSALAGMHVSNKLERYKELYGELPEEETEKKKETKKRIIYETI